jgi:putative PEP-CTERM system histidine kinase
MSFALPQLVIYLSFLGYLTGAVVCAVAALWIWKSGDRSRPDCKAGIIAAGVTALWCGLAAAADGAASITQLAETARNLAWIYLLFRLFANDGRDESMMMIRPVIFVLAGVQLLQPVLLIMQVRYPEAPDEAILAFHISAIFNMLTAIGALVLVHNLYAGATNSARQLLRWSAAAMVGIWAYDLNYYTVSYLSSGIPLLLLAFRGAIAGLMVVALAIGANSTTLGLQLRPSRAVTFQTLSLIVIGVYLLAMSMMSEALVSMGGEFARLIQVAFLAFAILAAIIWIPSQRARKWLRVTATKHLFQHRYDYRAEWLRFTHAIGEGSDAEESFDERAIKVMADITESPSGLLLIPNEEAQLELAARWQWPKLEVPAQASEHRLAGLLEERSFVLDLDQAREGVDHFGEADLIPQWLLDAKDAWAVVPLLHFDRLVGAVVLGRPQDSRQLDWEDFDLLRVVGQQLASYLAERAGQQALMDANRFDEFNRRMAFVMHDIKNLASQLSLLARNAEIHADKPDFRADMLVTLRNSSDKLNALITRLGRYGTAQKIAPVPLDLAALARKIAQRFSTSHQVTVPQATRCTVLADEEALDQALTHLVQNAIDASEANSPVFLDVSHDGVDGTIEVIDSGEGMEAGFVKNGLFKPFISSKNGGFGIGAFEARELVRGMGGNLDVESRESIGTRFRVTLPLAKALELRQKNQAGSPAEQSQSTVAGATGPQEVV